MMCLIVCVIRASWRPESYGVRAPGGAWQPHAGVAALVADTCVAKIAGMMQAPDMNYGDQVVTATEVTPSASDAIEQLGQLKKVRPARSPPTWQLYIWVAPSYCFGVLRRGTFVVIDLT